MLHEFRSCKLFSSKYFYFFNKYLRDNRNEDHDSILDKNK